MQKANPPLSETDAVTALPNSHWGRSLMAISVVPITVGLSTQREPAYTFLKPTTVLFLQTTKLMLIAVLSVMDMLGFAWENL
jgi:hypothetical protein